MTMGLQYLIQGNDLKSLASAIQTSLEMSSRSETWIAVITFILTVAGWFAAFHFGTRSQRSVLKTEMKIKIYGDFIKLVSKVFRASREIYSALSPTFVLPPTMTIAYKFPKESSDSHHKIWNDHTVKLNDLENRHAEAYTSMFEFLDAWSHLTPGLDRARKILFAEESVLGSKLRDHIVALLVRDTSNFPNWNIDEMKSTAEDVTSKISNVSHGLLWDFSNLFYNELLGDLYPKKKDRRAHVKKGRTFTILTKQGLEEVQSTGEELEGYPETFLKDVLV